MKKILLSTLILFAVAAVSCEKKDMELRGDDIIKFNDPNFLKALLTYECAYTEEYQPISVDADNDGNISVNEVQNIITLSFSKLPDEESIKDVSEIKYFKSLKYLYCDNNKLSTLDLSKNSALEELTCENNQLASLDLSGNAALVTLYCDGNKLKKIVLPSENSLPESYIKHIIKEYCEIVEYK